MVVANHRFPPSAAFAADCSAAPFIIKPGVNRLPFTVQTRYQACTQAASQATRNLPACLDGRQLMPPLPVGRYEAVLDGDGQAPAFRLPRLSLWSSFQPPGFSTDSLTGM